MTFQDHFSAPESRYSAFRPTYPDELFEYLAGIVDRRSLAWDCATGGGQAALPLRRHFDRVLATDASLTQLSRRSPASGVGFAAALAESPPLPDASIDLITLSQALHWLDFDRFYGAADRVLKSEGVLAAWTYSLVRIDPVIDAVVDWFHDEVVGPYWPPERAHVKSGYREIPFPLERIAAPRLEMRVDWSFDRLVGYLGTWSALARFRRALGSDPLPELERRLGAAWGPRDEPREAIWELTLLVGRKSA